MSEAYLVLRKCVQNKTSVSFVYKDHVRICSPHALGTTGGKERVLVYQYGGTSSQGLPAGGEWRCIDIENISKLSTRPEDSWHTSDRHTRQQTCVKSVDVEVNH